VHRILETDGFERLFHRILRYALGDESVKGGYKWFEGGRLCASGEEERLHIVCGIVVFLIAVIDVSSCVAEDV